MLRRPASFDEVFTAFISDVHHDAVQIFRVSDCRENIVKVIKGKILPRVERGTLLGSTSKSTVSCAQAAADRVVSTSARGFIAEATSQLANWNIAVVYEKVKVEGIASACNFR